jgi:hypothetical protein
LNIDLFITSDTAPALHGCNAGTKVFLYYIINVIHLKLPPEIDGNKTAMGLPPVTSTVFLITN